MNKNELRCLVARSAARSYPPEVRVKLPCLLETKANGEVIAHRHNSARNGPACDRPNPASHYEDVTIGRAIKRHAEACAKEECKPIAEHLAVLESSEPPDESFSLDTPPNLVPRVCGGNEPWHIRRL